MSFRHAFFLVDTIFRCAVIKIAFLLMKLAVAGKRDVIRGMKMAGMNETERGTRNNNNVLTSVCNNLSIARSGLLIQRNCHLLSVTRKRTRAKRKKTETPVLLSKFYQFRYFLATVRQRFQTPPAKRLFSCLCASAGFVWKIAEPVYNVAWISRAVLVWIYAIQNLKRDIRMIRRDT